MHSIESNKTYWKLLEAHGRLWKIMEAWIRPNWWYSFIIEWFLHRVLLLFWKVWMDERTEILMYWVALSAYTFHLNYLNFCVDLSGHCVNTQFWLSQQWCGCCSLSTIHFFNLIFRLLSGCSPARSDGQQIFLGQRGLV